MPCALYVLLALNFFFFLESTFEQRELRIYWTDFHYIPTV